MYVCFAYNENESDGEKTIMKHDFSSISDFKIIIGTFQAFHKMLEENKKFQQSERISHLIVDEAGQATEPDTTIPMTLLNPQKVKLILAEDPNGHRRRMKLHNYQRCFVDIVYCGKGERPAGSTSWVNRTEADHVAIITWKLLQLSHVEAADIGIISFYADQRDHIPQELSQLFSDAVVKKLNAALLSKSRAKKER